MMPVVGLADAPIVASTMPLAFMMVINDDSFSVEAVWTSASRKSPC